MEVMEAVVLVIGIILFFVSFFIGEGKKEEESRSISEDEIKQLVQDEYDRTRDKLGSITDETVTYSMEKAERQLEKLTNEKMLAMGEYSDTIMNQINTSHQEVVFLSDMLSKNKNDLTLFLGQAMKEAKEAQSLSEEALLKSNDAKAAADEAQRVSREAAESSAVAEEKMLSARKAITGAASEKSDNTESESANSESSPKKTRKPAKEQVPETADINEAADNQDKPAKKKSGRKKKQEAEDDTFYGSQISLNFDTAPDGNENNNEKILNLHKMGKSNVAIAKELGLGVGEVKLVIDLFK